MTDGLYLLAWVIPSIVGISMLDYVIFHDFLRQVWRCDYCNVSVVNKNTFIIATALELLLFLAGFAIGRASL
jgi:hypothetical protein